MKWNKKADNLFKKKIIAKIYFLNAIRNMPNPDKSFFQPSPTPHHR